MIVIEDDLINRAVMQPGRKTVREMWAMHLTPKDHDKVRLLRDAASNWAGDE